MKRREPLCGFYSLALLAAALLLACPTIGRASTRAASCSPFCGVLHFMTPPARAAARPVHAAAIHRRIARPIRVVRVLAPPAYPRIVTPRYRYWHPVYQVYAYPGYGYVYYYVMPYGYRAY